MKQRNLHAPPAVITIFGASGDLTRRKLVPAPHSLACEGLMSPATRVIAAARTPLSDQRFHDRLYEGVVDYTRLKPSTGICELWSRFVARYSYLAGNYDDPETYCRLAEQLARLDTESGTQGNRLFYLATPPVLFPVIIGHLGRAGLNRSELGWVRSSSKSHSGLIWRVPNCSTSRSTPCLMRARYIALTTI